MGPVVEIAITPDGDTFTPELDRIVAQAADLMPAFGVIYATFLATQRSRFEREGPGWSQLAESTVRQRERLGIGGAHPILDRTGASYRGREGGGLKGSLTDPGHEHAVYEPGIDELFMGTDDPVAEFHQKGTDRMPARTLVEVDEGDAVMWAGILSEHLFGGPGLSATASVTGGLVSVGPVGL